MLLTIFFIIILVLLVPVVVLQDNLIRYICQVATYLKSHKYHTKSILITAPPLLLNKYAWELQKHEKKIDKKNVYFEPVSATEKVAISRHKKGLFQKIKKITKQTHFAATKTGR